MALTPERIAELDRMFAEQQPQQPDYLTQLVPDKPAGMTQQRIAELDQMFASQQPQQIPQPQVSVGKDVAKSIGSGLAQGALGVPFGIADLANSLIAGPQYLGRGIAENIDKAIGIAPQPRGEIWQPFYGSADAAQELGVDYQPQTMAGKLTSIPAQMTGGLVAGRTLNSVANTPQSKSTSFLRNNSSEPAVKIPTSQELRATGSELFKKSDSMGGLLQPKVTDSWVDDASKILPQTNAGKILAGKTETTDLVERMAELKGKPLTLSEAQEVDSMLGDMAAVHVDPKTGKLLEEGVKIKKIQQSLRDKIETAKPADIVNKDAFDTWKEAKNQWAASYRMNDVERIIMRAQMSDNPVTVLRNGFKNMVTNKANLYGYNKEEIAAMQHAARTGIVTGALKTAGSKLISGVAGATGGAIGGGWPGAMMGAAAGEAAGYPMRSIANQLQLNRATKVQETIAKRVNK